MRPATLISIIPVLLVLALNIAIGEENTHSSVSTQKSATPADRTVAAEVTDDMFPDGAAERNATISKARELSKEGNLAGLTELLDKSDGAPEELEKLEASLDKEKDKSLLELIKQNKALEKKPPADKNVLDEKNQLLQKNTSDMTENNKIRLQALNGLIDKRALEAFKDNNYFGLKGKTLSDLSQADRDKLRAAYKLLDGDLTNKLVKADGALNTWDRLNRLSANDLGITAANNLITNTTPEVQRLIKKAGESGFFSNTRVKEISTILNTIAESAPANTKPQGAKQAKPQDAGTPNLSRVLALPSSDQLISNVATTVRTVALPLGVVSPNARILASSNFNEFAQGVARGLTRATLTEGEERIEANLTQLRSDTVYTQPRRLGNTNQVYQSSHSDKSGVSRVYSATKFDAQGNATTRDFVGYITKDKQKFAQYKVRGTENFSYAPVISGQDGNMRLASNDDWRTSTASPTVAPPPNNNPKRNPAGTPAPDLQLTQSSQQPWRMPYWNYTQRHQRTNNQRGITSIDR